MNEFSEWINALEQNDSFRESLSATADISLILAALLFIAKIISSLLIGVRRETYKDAFIGMVLVMVYLAVLVIFFYIKKPWASPAIASALGQMGDYFGGMLNPILAFASFIALLFTIKLQSEEMRDTRKELMQSRVAQELAANTASDNLRQQKDLAEFEGFKSLLIGQLDDLNKIFYASRAAHTITGIQDIVLTHRFDKDGNKAWSIIKVDIQSKLSIALVSSHAANFWSNVVIAKRILKSMYASASRLQMVGDDSVYRHFATQVSFYCCMASFTVAGQKLALETNNPVLAEEIAKYWQMMNVDPVDTPQN